MSHRLHRRARGEQGFTLIELLVVILIIGILAAIAIPAFLNQKSKASDAAAKELVRTAETAAETYSTDHNGEYGGLTATTLHAVEPTLQTAAGKGNAWLSEAKELEAGKGYEVSSASTNGDEFNIIKKAGVVERTCEVKAGNNKGGCPNGTW